MSVTYLGAVALGFVLGAGILCCGPAVRWKRGAQVMDIMTREQLRKAWMLSMRHD